MTVVNAIRASELQRAFGINIHLDWNKPNQYIPDVVIANLNYLNISLVRHGAILGPDSAHIALAGAGIRSFYYVSPLARTAQQVADWVATAAGWAPGYVVAIEGPNEYNLFPITYGGQSDIKWSDSSPLPPGPPAVATALGTYNFMVDFVPRARAKAALSGVPIFPPTLGSAKNQGALDTAASGDWRAIGFDGIGAHPYTPIINGAPVPPDVDLPDHRAANDLTEFDYTYGRTETAFNGGIKATRYIASEYGYNVSGITASMRAAGNLTAFMSLFHNHGCRLLTVYELKELGDGWGHFDASNNPTTAAVATKNFLSKFVDTGSNALTFDPGSLDFTASALTGDLSATGLSSGKVTVTRRTDGTFVLVSFYQPSLNAAAVSRSFTFASNASVSVFDPITGQTTQSFPSVAAGTSITVVQPPYPVILEVTTGTVITPPPPPANVQGINHSINSRSSNGLNMSVTILR